MSVFSLCADEELTTLKGIEGETSEDKPTQQVNISMHVELCIYPIHMTFQLPVKKK